MSMPTEAVEALHEATAALKAEHEHRDDWLKSYDHNENGSRDKLDPLPVTRVEAEAIFAQRIAAHEARLKELGWSRTVRVEPQPEVTKS